MLDKTTITKGAPKTILVVEDEESMREALKERMTQDGYTVVVADTAEEALKLLDQKSFSLALIDLRLEESQSGLDIIEELRKVDSPHKDTAILVLTGIYDPAMTMELKAQGVDSKDYLIKTEHSLDDIAECVKKRLAR